MTVSHRRGEGTVTGKTNLATIFVGGHPPRRARQQLQGAPAALSHSAQRVHQRLSVLSESVIEQRVLSLISSDGDEQAQRDCLIIQQDKSIEDTVREQLIAARLGQGTFRKNCLMLYPACPVTGTTFAPLLRASHIKPWPACENGNERLDPFNGIILAAHIDILFDQGGGV